MAKKNKEIAIPLPKGPLFALGDKLLIEVYSNYVGQDVWVGEVISIERSSYLVKSLSTEGRFITKIPFLFERMISKIDPEKLENTIKAIKILYY